jgi:drug/metabolite transporter (DMT)-like permease
MSPRATTTNRPAMSAAAAHLRERAGIAFVTAGATAFGFITTLSRLAYDTGATPLTVVALRTAAFVLVAGILLRFKSQPMRLSRAGFKATLWLAITAFGMAVGYLSSVAFIPVSLAALIFYTNPLLTGVMTALAGRERLTPGKAAALIAAFLGLALALGPSFEVLDWRGIAWALVAALSVAATSAFGGKVLERDSSLAVNFFTNLWLLPLVLLLGPLAGSWAWPGSTAGALAAGGAISCYILGYMLWFMALARISGVRVAMMLNIEPVVTIAFAVAALGERLSAAQYGGVVLTVGALIAFSLASRRRRSGAGPEHESAA